MVQADRNYGFAGSVYEPQWARLISGGQSARWSVTGQGDLQVTAGTGDRALRVAPGGAVGDGVLSEWDAAVTVAGGQVGSGGRWDTVVIRRDWEQSTSTVMVLEGGSQRALSGLVESTPGVVSDQPLALVRFAAGSTVAQEIIDLRTWTGAGGGMVAAHADALQYLGALGTTVTVGTTRWTRIERGGSPTWVRDDFSAPELVTPTGIGTSAPGWLVGEPGLNTQIVRHGPHRSIRIEGRRTGPTFNFYANSGNANLERVMTLNEIDRPPLLIVGSFIYRQGTQVRGGICQLGANGNLDLVSGEPNSSITNRSGPGSGGQWSIRAYFSFIRES